jgi:hypothetical protein
LKPLPEAEIATGDLAAALADAVDALCAVSISHLEGVERRLLGRATGAGLAVAGCAATVVSWACVNVAIAFWLSALYGPVVAAAVACAAHGLGAIALFGFARAALQRPITTPIIMRGEA